MINPLSLIKETPAYKSVLGDKKSDRLSHAYLIICPDKKFLKEYLKIFARLVVCNDSEFCGFCRDCRLIDSEIHPDVLFYPKGESVLTADIENVVEESFIKPIESDKKVFVISNGEGMNASSQNKLLKTLEEPPKNVHIIIGATNEFSFLPTIISRVKKLTIEPFSKEKIYSLLKAEYGESEKLKSAVSCGDGTLGKAIDLYASADFEKITALVKDVLLNMQSSKNVLEYSVKVNSAEINFDEFLSVLEIALRDMLTVKMGKEELSSGLYEKEVLESAKGFTAPAIMEILEKITQAVKRKKFNNNQVMLVDWLLFAILEGKHKWQKS